MSGSWTPEGNRANRANRTYWSYGTYGTNRTNGVADAVALLRARGSGEGSPGASETGLSLFNLDSAVLAGQPGGWGRVFHPPGEGHQATTMQMSKSGTAGSGDWRGQKQSVGGGAFLGRDRAGRGSRAGEWDESARRIFCRLDDQLIFMGYN